MPSTYSPLLRVELQASGENDTTWGDKTNVNLETVLEAAIAGAATVTLADADHTLSTNFGSDDEARKAIIVVGGALTAARNVICPASSKVYILRNDTTGGFAVTLKTSGGTGVAVAAGSSAILYCDGTNVKSATPSIAAGTVGPTAIDSTSTNAWRFNAALGVNYNQAYVPNYGVIGVDGLNGSYTSYYMGGELIGTVAASTSGFSLEAGVNQSIILKTGNLTRVTVDKAGAVTVAGALTTNSLSTGALTASSATVSGNMSVTGTVTAGGYAGLTAANVNTALGYTPVQAGTGIGQQTGHLIKFGWTGSKLAATVDNSNLGNVVFEGYTGFIPSSGSNGRYDVASSAAGTDASTASFMLREAGHNGAVGGNVSYAPRLAFYWSGVNASQITLQANGILRFVDQGGTTNVGIYASDGYFTGNVYGSYSDMRLKNKVADIRCAMDKVRKLSGFLYERNALATELGVKDEGMLFGVSAQDVEDVAPELVKPAPFDMEADKDSPTGWKSKSGENYKTVDYSRLSVLLLEALKEIDARLTKLEQQ